MLISVLSFLGAHWSRIWLCRPLTQFLYQCLLNSFAKAKQEIEVNLVKHHVPGLVLLAAALALNGCVSMNMDECLTADWTTVGYQDGAKGRTSDSVSRHRKACSKYGVTPDLIAYLEGWDDGVVRYCTPYNGFNSGSRGESYAGVCPSDLEEAFVAAHSDGRRLYILQVDVQDIERDLHRAEARLADVEDLVVSKEAHLVSADRGIEDRVELLADVKRLSEERGELRRSIADLEYERGRAEVELEHFQSSMSSEYGL
jgi:uncharacterized protein DUF2799